MSTRAWLPALALACGAPCLHAETVYVVEQLYVTVTSEPDGSGERVGQIKSGDKLELLERQDDQAHVRLSTGMEGWVKTSYLSPDLPLKLQLSARTEELEKIRKEKTQLEADLGAARKSAASAAAAASSSKASTPVPGPAASAPLPTPEPAVPSSAESETRTSPPLFENKPMMPARPTWLATVASVLVALGVGFAAGWRMLDRRIRAKYGGLRIY